LPNELQAKLLRVLEKGEFQRLGETQVRRSRARIVAATNRNLRNEVRLGNFRVDLYHRLSVFTLEVPPLRDLGNDKLELLQHFKEFYALECNLPSFILDESALAAWQRYTFSGNVRELRNIVIRLTTRYAGQTVTAAMLEEEFDWSAGDKSHTGWMMDGCTQPVESLVAQAQRVLETAANSGSHFELDQTLRNLERAYLDAAMAITRGNMTQAAKLLGIHRTTLYSRLEALDRNLASAKLTPQR
jgi:two-component system nitrogen regulation response regulator GlnG